jgi:hypothetical protein
VLARLSIVGALLALILVVAGCGGGGSSTDEARPTESPAQTAEGAKEDFIAEADAQCSDYQAQVAPIKAELEALEKVTEPESPQNEKQLGELLREAGADAESELESLRELEAPQGDEATIEKLFDTAEEANGLAGEGAAALEEGDTKRFGELVAEGEAFNARTTKMAESYGLKVCGQAP